ncbi:hypothetical protein YTPLAS18_12680 [Nitrospira sp.]|nr:hypothetical protein YTPLAS18_12680 [Nitrospira sp.]
MKPDGDSQTRRMIDRVRALPRAEWSAFLRRECADPDLRRAVERQLEAEEGPGAWSSQSGDDMETLIATPSMYRGHSAEKPGDVIDHYRLVEQIGEGGFGVVWRAEQSQPVQREVALKIIKLGMDTRQVIARFEAERQALAMMDHPHIAKVLDAGATATGRPFFVMELVRGTPITQYCDGRNMLFRDRLRLFIQVCGAVQHAHQKGVIHRDIKPSNVLVATVDGAPAPKVIDFGIAKATEARLTEHTMFTELGQFLGTPAYMSPEQADPTSLDIDTRSDIYSLGVLLYELLTGTTPFDPRTLRGVALDEIKRRIREEEPSRPSTRLASLGADLDTVARMRSLEPRKLTTTLRGDLDWIIMKALEKDRSRRYESAGGFAVDIERYLNNEPVSAGPPSAVYRVRKFIRRNRGGVAAAGLVSVSLIVALAALAYGFVKVRHERNLKEEALVEAKRKTEVALAINEFLNTDLLAATSPMNTDTPVRDISMRTVLDAAARRLEDDASRARFAEMPVVEASIEQTIGMTYLQLGVADEAERHVRRSVELATSALGASADDTLIARVYLAQVLTERSRYREAEALLRDVLSIFDQKNAPPEDRGRLLAEGDYGRVLMRLGRWGEAEALIRAAIKACEAELGPDDQNTITAMANLVIVLREAGKLEEVSALAQDVLERRRRVFGPTHPLTVRAENQLALIYSDMGRFAEAEPLLKNSVEYCRRIFGGTHYETLTAQNNLAVLYLDTHRYAEAEPLMREVVEGRIKEVGAEHSLTLQGQNNLAVILSSQGKTEEALALRLTTLDTMKRLLGPEHPETLNSIANLAVLYKTIGRLDEAEKLHLETLEARERLLGPDNPATITTLENLGGVYFTRGDMAATEEILQRVLESRKRTLGPENPAVTRTIYNLARVTDRKGDLEKALELYQQAADRFRAEFGDDDVSLAEALKCMGAIRRKQRESDQAIKLFTEVLRIRRARAPEPDASVADAQFDLAAAYFLIDDLESAEPLLREALEIDRRLLPPNNSNTINCVYGLARLLARTHRCPEGEPLALEHLKMADAAYGEGSDTSIQGIKLLVELYERWDADEPGKGYDAKAAEWRDRLPAP